MSPSAPVVAGRSLAAALERAGFERRGQRGSHLKLRHPGSGRIVIVPLHSELAPGTLASVCRQAGWTPPELQQHLARRRREHQPLER
ncbi:MAG: type II toxin-antitoxin system HicA family toxin [Candidatus Dormibacteria bacterium]